MLKTKDFKRQAKEALSGKWLEAAAVGLVAGILGASLQNSSSFVSSISGSGESLAELFTGTLGTTSGTFAILMAVILVIVLVMVLWGLAVWIIGGATTLGYAKYNLNLVDGKKAKFKDIFSQYNRLGTGFLMRLLISLFVMLWTLLLIIPGIIASYSYQMTPFILCENPDMKARDAIRESKQMMKGNKWRLFCLYFSFLGWYLIPLIVVLIAMATIAFMIFFVEVPLTTIALGISLIGLYSLLILYLLAASFVLNPYIAASVAAFYREISKKDEVPVQEEVNVEQVVYAIPEESPTEELKEEPEIVEE